MRANVPPVGGTAAIVIRFSQSKTKMNVDILYVSPSYLAVISLIFKGYTYMMRAF